MIKIKLCPSNQIFKKQIKQFNYCQNSKHKFINNKKNHQEVQLKLINLSLEKKENTILARLKYKTKIIKLIKIKI